MRSSGNLSKETSETIPHPPTALENNSSSDPTNADSNFKGNSFSSHSSDTTFPTRSASSKDKDEEVWAKSIHVVCMLGNYELLKIYLKSGIDVNATDFRGNTAIMGPFGGRDEEIRCMQLLIESKADVNAKNLAGNTSMMLNTNYPKVLKILLDAEANTEIEDASGRTVLEYCVSTNKYAAVELLRNHGAICRSTKIAERVAAMKTEIKDLCEERKNKVKKPT